MSYLEELLQNISCKQSSDRSFIIQATSILTPLLDFDNEILRSSVEWNIKNNYIYADESILLLLSTNDSMNQRKSWLIEQLKEKKTNSTNILQQLLNTDKKIENHFFKDTFNEIKEHILFRILKHHYNYPLPDLFDTKEKPAKILSNYKDDHPLNTSLFEY